MYAYQQAFSLANFNYGSAISFALGGVVFICVYVFLFATRKRGSFLHDAPTHTSVRARRPPTRSATSRCRSCLGFLVVYFLVPFWWLIVNSSKNAAGPVRRRQRPVVLRRHRLPRRTSSSCSPTTAASTCGGCSTPRSTPSPAASAPRSWPCWPATASPSTGSPAALQLRHPARRGDGAADRAGHPDLHHVLQARPDEHDLGGDPPVAAEPVRGLPDARLRARRGARRAPGRRAGRRRGGVHGRSSRSRSR